METKYVVARSVTGMLIDHQIMEDQQRLKKCIRKCGNQINLDERVIETMGEGIPVLNHRDSISHLSIRIGEWKLLVVN